jgi:Protein of unknown function (DUF559)
MVQVPENSRVHACAVTYLIDGHQDEAARILLSCNLTVEEYYHQIAIDEGYMDGLEVELAVQRAIYEIISNEEHPTTKLIVEAIKYALNEPYYHFGARLLLPEVAPDWKEKMLEAIQEQVVSNQGNPIANNPTYSWNNLRFRSNTEIKVAQVLDRLGILFFPNCMARLGSIGERRNKEADFLICEDSKWGILEVDGEAYHSTAATDHERDRYFRAYGIRVIERFTATRCYNNPEVVVQEFLSILRRNA